MGFAGDDSEEDDVAEQPAARRDDVLAKLQGGGGPVGGGVAGAMTSGLKSMVGNTLRKTVGRVVDGSGRHKGSGTQCGVAV